MKKSQSIFLLSGLVPLVAAPIAIVASCSSDNTTTTSQNAQDEVKRLNELITSSKFKIKDGTTFDQAQIDELKKTPDKLLTDYLDKTELKLDENKFTYNVETDGFSVTPPTDNTKDGTINFKIKVTNKSTTTETATTNAATVAYKPSNQATPTNPLLDEAVKKIQDAHSAKTFKLKTAKETMTEADVTKLTADPNLLLKDEFTDGFPALEQGITASINKTNFSIVDKKQAQGTAKAIQFKVTVTDAQKVEKDTQQLSFDFTLQAAQQPTQKLETQTNTEITVASLALTNATPTRDEIKQGLVNEAKIFEKKDVIFKQGADLITAASDINTITWEDVASDATKVVLKFKVAANKWYDPNGQVGTTVKDLSVTITGLNQ